MLGFRLAAAACAIAFLPSAATSMIPERPGDPPPDPLDPLVHRIDQYFQRNEVDGVAIDARYVVNYTEAVRLSVTSQLLGYDELYRVHPTARLRRDIVQRADFLIARLDQVLSGSPFDGMLGYALLQAYEMVGEPRFLESGTLIVDQLEAIPRGELILNGGLMSAMAFTEYHHVTGDPVSQQAAHDVLASLPPYQHADGSFPHWCTCSRDVHYTDWMAMELILIRRTLDDPVIEPMLERMDAFLRGRVDPSGVTRYEDPCSDYPGCRTYYYSIATGCSIDYDTRAFTNELGYTALLFDHFHERQYAPVMRFLDSLEKDGAIPDKWDFWPPPGDPYYVWTAADTSVVNMSVIFWSLAAIVGERHHDAGECCEGDDDWSDDGASGATVAAGAAGDALGDGLEIRRGSGPGRRARPSHPSIASAAPWQAVNRMLASPNSGQYCDDTPGPGRRGPDEVARRGPLVAPRPGPSRALTGSPSAPREMRLGPIVPNPTRSGCDVRFVIREGGTVSLAVYDASGRSVREICSGSALAGEHSFHWDGRDANGTPCPSGLYFVRLGQTDRTRWARVIISR